MKALKFLAALALTAALVGPSGAAGLFTNGLPVAGSVPNTMPFTGNETFPADTNLTQGLNPATEAITAAQMSGLVGGQLDSYRNKLIGGDFNTNLWARGTTSASITTAALYTADRWWGLSGTGTAFTVIKQTGATDISPPFGASARVQRTAAQSGVLPVCVGQILSSQNSFPLAGKQVEFSFYAKTGANFSAASSVVTVTIASGTGLDGTTANFTTGAWTGYAAAVAQATTLSTSFERYSAVATIPAAAVQVGVKICYTPVGTAGTNDWFEFADAQLDANPGALAKSAPAATDFIYAFQLFEGRPASLEALLQQQYFYEVDESATIWPLAVCSAVDVTHTNCFVQFPTTMRIAPTVTYATGFATPTSTTQATLGACSALANAATVASTIPNIYGVLVNCTATTIPAAGVASFLYSNNGTGKIIATAEL